MDLSEHFTQVALRAAAGEHEAFAQLYQYYEPRIRQRYYLFLHQHDEAEQLAADFWGYFWEHIVGYQAQEQTAFTTFLYRCAQNYLIDHKRKLREKYVHLSLGTCEFEDEQSFQEKTELRMLLLPWLEQLPIEQQTIIRAVHFQGWSYRELAERTGKTEGAIKQYYWRGIKRLRQIAADSLLTIA